MCILNKFKIYKSIYCLFFHMLEMAECPIHYPNAHKNGARCCKHHMDCHGGVISIESECCKDNEFIECSTGNCINTGPKSGK